MGAALLPRNKGTPYTPMDPNRQQGSFLKVLVVVVCCLNAYFCISALRPSCPQVRQLLSTSAAAAAATATALEASSNQPLVGEQQDSGQPQALVQSATCAVKVEDISSWANAGLNEPPFHFPKIIHQTVEDKSNVSCESLACMQTWMDMNPDYEHRLVDAKERREFVETHYPEILKVYESLGTNVERADLWRYLALHKYGGVYADSDVRCMKPIDEWNEVNGHDADMLVGVVFTDKKTNMITRVNNFIIAAMPCHPVMAAMPFTTMSKITQSALNGGSVRNEKGKGLTNGVVGRTGPVALTGTIQEYAGRNGAEWPLNANDGLVDNRGNLVGRVRMMPRNVMTMGWETAESKISCEEAHKLHPEAYICHQYFGTWKAEYKHRPALTFSDKCTYQGLKEQYGQST